MVRILEKTPGDDTTSSFTMSNDIQDPRYVCTAETPLSPLMDLFSQCVKVVPIVYYNGSIVRSGHASAPFTTFGPALHEPSRVLGLTWQPAQSSGFLN